MYKTLQAFWSIYIFTMEVGLVFEILRMQKTCILCSRQHMTTKTVISLKIQQNIDLLQRVSLKNVDCRLKLLKFGFHVNVRPQRFQIIYRQLKFWFHITTPPHGQTLISLREQCNFHFTQRLSSKTSIPGQNGLQFWFHVKTWWQGCWFDLKTSKIFISRCALPQKPRFQVKIG